MIHFPWLIKEIDISGRFDLTDKEWAIIEPLLPNKPCGVPRVDDRTVLNSIVYEDENGNLQITQIEVGGPESADISDLVAQVGAENVVSVVHNHPNGAMYPGGVEVSLVTEVVGKGANEDVLRVTVLAYDYWGNESVRSFPPEFNPDPGNFNG